MSKIQCAGFELETEIAPMVGVKPELVQPRKTENVFKIMEYNIRFAKDKLGNMYFYENGIYKPNKDRLFQCYCALLQYYKVDFVTARYREFDTYLSGHTEELLDKPLEDRINFRNGIYYILEERFELHSEVDHSEYKTTIQIPINYNPSAICPNIDTFFDEVFPGGAELLYDIVGVCMTSVTSQAKAVVLLGDGSNGKSSFLYGLRSLVGMDNCSTVPMHVLADRMDKFSASNLVGKLVNAADDMSQQQLLDTAIIKSIISGNTIRIEGKYKSGANYTPFCKLVFGANHRLTSGDDTSGYSRRIMHVPFSKVFSVNPTKEREIHEAFDNEEERSGLLNQVLKRLKHTVSHGFMIPDEVRNIVDNYVPISSSDEELLKTILVEDLEGKIPVYNLHVWCCGAEYTGGREVLKAHIKYLFPKSKIGRPRYEGRQLPSFMGISVKSGIPDFGGNTVDYNVMNCVVPEGTVADLDPEI